MATLLKKAGPFSLFERYSMVKLFWNSCHSKRLMTLTDLTEWKCLLSFGSERPARRTVGNAEVKISIAVSRIEKVENLLFVDGVANKAEALLVRRSHSALNGRGRVVHHLNDKAEVQTR